MTAQAMTTPRVYQTEAVVIKRMNLGEADRILTLYTTNLGKIKAVAKGTRRPKSKLGGHVELITHSQLMLARGRNLDIITQAQTINNFLPLKENLASISRGMYVSELVDSFTDEHLGDRRIFDLLLDTLYQLSMDKHGDTVLRYFELHFLDYLGYRPQLRQCTSCDSSLQPVTNFFSCRYGGILCTDCAYQEPLAHPISVNALKVLRLWQNHDYATAFRVKINPQLASELENVMRDYIRYLLERQLKSTAWVDKLTHENQHATQQKET